MVPTLLILGPSSLAQPQMSSCISQLSQVVSCNIGKDPGDWQCPFLYCSWYNFIMAQLIERRYSNQTHCDSNYMICRIISVRATNSCYAPVCQLDNSTATITDQKYKSQYFFAYYSLQTTMRDTSLSLLSFYHLPFTVG
jgi:hypothetical protein